MLTEEEHGSELGFNIVNQLVSTLSHTRMPVMTAQCLSINSSTARKQNGRAWAVYLFLLEPYCTKCSITADLGNNKLTVEVVFLL